MATQQQTVDFLLEQMAGAGLVSARKMFGEYGLYCDGKLFALICDDQLFLKPTSAGRLRSGDVSEGAPYPGAKPCLMIPGERWDDADWLADLVQVTVAALPAPASRKSRSGSRR